MKRVFKTEARLLTRKRRDKKLTQTQLSKLLNFKNGQFISNIERGLCGLPNKSVMKTCEILDINIFEYKDAKKSDYNINLNNEVRND